MGKMLLSALAAAALLSPAIFGGPAQASTVAVPSGATETGLVQKSSHCYRRCQRTYPRYYGYYRPYR